VYIVTVAKGKNESSGHLHVKYGAHQGWKYFETF